MAQINESSEFPADDEMPTVFPDFNEGGEMVNRRAIPWGEVPEYVYFKVLNIRKVTKRSSGAMAMIMTLQRRGGSTFETWATSLIEKDIEARMAEADKAGKFLFVKSLGKKTSKVGRDYWNFVFFCK